MQKKLYIFLIAWGFTGALLFSNPLIRAETETSITVVDADGEEVHITKNPDRVIVHHTSLLGLWYLAGGESTGRPESRGYGIPARAKPLPVTGSVTYPNVEIILSLKPNLVILGNMNTHRDLSSLLSDLDIQCLLLNYENYSDFANIFDLFARIIGKGSADNSIIPKIEAQIQAARANHTDKPAPSFLSLFASTRSVSAELNGAHTAHIASRLGGDNITERLAGHFGTKRVPLSLERIIEQDPDIIFITPMGDVSKVRNALKEDLTSNSAWSSLTAVRKGRVYYLPEDLFLYRPNERFPKAFEYLAGLLYQEE